MSRDLDDLHGEPWFPLLYQRWRRDTSGLTMEQRSAYLDLLCAQIDSDGGVLPVDDAFLCWAARCPIERFEEVVRPLLRSPFFLRRGGGLVNARALWCWSKRNSRRQKARAAANARWLRQKDLLLTPENAPSNAPSNATGRCEIEREREREIERETPPTPPRGGSGASAPGPGGSMEALPVQQAIVAVWEETMGAVATRNNRGRFVGGMDPRRIVQAVMPLVLKHGRHETLGNFKNYLSTREPQFCTPEDFAARYVAWSKGRGVRPVPL